MSPTVAAFRGQSRHRIKVTRHRSAFGAYSACCKAPCDKLAVASTSSLGTYYHQASLGIGELTVRPINRDDTRAICVLLTRAFSGKPGAIVFSEAITFVEDIFTKYPDGVVLAARLVPKDPSMLPAGATSRLIGATTLSFAGSTRTRVSIPNAAKDFVYLSNMAVDPQFRRCGVAKALLVASEEVIRAIAAPRQVYLHVYNNDRAASQLYSSVGYKEVHTSFFPLPLTPRPVLMEKDVL